MRAGAVAALTALASVGMAGAAPVAAQAPAPTPPAAQPSPFPAPDAAAAAAPPAPADAIGAAQAAPAAAAGVPGATPPPALAPPPPEAVVAEAIWQAAGDGLDAAGAGIDDALAQGLADLGPAQGAWVANAVLAAAGVPLLPRTPRGAAHVVATAANPFRVRPPAAAEDAAPGLAAALAAQSLGTPQTLALGLTQKFASSTALATDLALRHAAGPLDVNVDVSGAQPLVGHGAMALQYDSHALVALVPQVQVGIAARGPLGTIADVRTEGDQTAGPLMRLRVAHRNLSFSTDAGYDFRLNPAAVAPTASDRFHVKVGLDIKL